MAFSGTWDYTTPATDAAPLTGTIVHADDSLKVINVHKTDDAAADRSAELEAVREGDFIYGAGGKWLIISIVDNGTYMTFNVNPPGQGAPDGAAVFVFGGDVGGFVGEPHRMNRRRPKSALTRRKRVA